MAYVDLVSIKYAQPAGISYVLFPKFQILQ
jgi:hypothetical protein